MLREVLRTNTQCECADPIALAFEAFEPRLEAADPYVQLIGIGPHDSSTSLDIVGGLAY